MSFDFVLGKGEHIKFEAANYLKLFSVTIDLRMASLVKLHMGRLSILINVTCFGIVNQMSHELDI